MDGLYTGAQTLWNYSKCKQVAQPPSSSHILTVCKATQCISLPTVLDCILHRQACLGEEQQSTIIPVPKINHPRDFNDFRPVALTSLVMKNFEKS